MRNTADPEPEADRKTGGGHPAPRRQASDNPFRVQIDQQLKAQALRRAVNAPWEPLGRPSVDARLPDSLDGRLCRQRASLRLGRDAPRIALRRF